MSQRAKLSSRIAKEEKEKTKEQRERKERKNDEQGNNKSCLFL
jgi:hypothetical protein